MNPLLPWRPTIAFVAALAMWIPTANAFVHGNLGVVPTGLRFVIALAASWIGVTILALVVGGYGDHAAARHEDAAPAPEASDEA